MKLLSPTTTVDCRQSLIVPTSKMAKISVQKMNQNSIDNNNVVVSADDDNNHIEIERKKSKSKSSSEIIEVNFCYTALISMCLGFLFIWSSVISLIFIVNKIDETRFMQKPLDIFIEQEQIGRVMFSVVFTVDSLVSIHLNLSDPQELSKSVNFTWDLTDDDIEDVKVQIENENSINNNDNNDLAKMIDSIETKLETIRSNLSLSTDHPLTMINSYKLIFDIAEQYSLERKFYQTPMMKHDNQWHLIKSFAQIQNSPIFIIHQRNESSSHELIENAFAWDSRIYHHYMELLRSKQYRSLQSISNQNYRLNGREYTRFVTDVVAYLLRAKDVLNVGIKEILINITDHNSTQFYAIISCIYLFVLILCSTFFILFIRNAKIKDESLVTINNCCLSTMINDRCNNSIDSEHLVDNQQQQQSQPIYQQVPLCLNQQQKLPPYYEYIDTISGQIDSYRQIQQLSR
ncbi:hypothetical protein DERP_006488 [Dermatophagoides pteronyssinus]|uniref:Uncharacterized protein n=1 Tax=Dermatophagoides pteronyssinus TaxID=6956 RepID=A0ABQ8IQR2_DERPT|nr:hypothetical protein DERP_006488 [Dermatophagoides pteronyssinus]